jgi:NarL family two-component system response regulator LiaR
MRVWTDNCYGISLMAGILIVDDNSSIRCLLRGFVETQTPFTVCGEAENGAEAIQRAKELAPNLILLDLSMPVMGGAEAAPVIKKMMPGTKIVLFSMHVGNGLRCLAATIGVDLALSKSDGVTQLGDHLQTLLEPDVPPVREAQSPEIDPARKPSFTLAPSIHLPKMETCFPETV